MRSRVWIALVMIFLLAAGTPFGVFAADKAVSSHKKVSSAPAPSNPNVIGGPDWNEEHTFTGGSNGQALVRDSTQTSGASWGNMVNGIETEGATSPCSANEIYKTVGGVWSCEPDAGASASGLDTQVQFNDGGVFGGDAGLTFNKSTNVLTATGGFVGDVNGNASSATALSANGANCSAGNFPLGVDAHGAVENCTAIVNDLASTGASSPCADTEIFKTVGGVWTCTTDASGGPGGSPGGSDTQVQFNDGSAFGGDAGLTFNKTTNVLTATGGFVGALTGNSSTATALASDPTDCAANQFGISIAASGNLGCAQVGYSQLSGVPSALVKTDQANTYSTGAQDFGSATSLKVPTAAGAAPTVNGQIAYDSTSHTFEGGVNGGNKTFAMTDSNITGNASTATALSADPANCGAGELAAGITAAGVAEGCVDVATQTELDNHINDTADAHAASAITNTPTGTVVATTVQDAIDELAAESALDVDGELVNPEVSTGSFILNGAGPPASGTCPHNKATYRDTVTLGDTYVCYGIGQNWHLIGENDDAFMAIAPDSGDTVIASGGTTLTLTGTAPLTFVGNNTTKTLTTVFTGEKCAVVDNVTSTDDLKLFSSFAASVTITSVWCNYEGSAPTLAATFTLSDGASNAMTITGTSPTCAAKTAVATAAAVTAANTLTARELLLFSVSNTPNPATDTYILCVSYTIP